ncbi:APC family permease [Clostridium fallax]|uniref:Serine/threonine exchange transporter, LAT family n=1 Tax=Clostridium fallax TaxID=1533 RepID=A0A1M4VYS4_9CLOT|nr:amino acid permease [Clostridium fallax]SHE73862.1 serine/threonine exchange transporter, LAT family [Clostridium fallax]SQB07751.1 amino acid permease [Clostridium fallax]
MDKTNTKSLKKSLGLFNAIAIVVGMVVGSGIFFKPSIVLQNAGSPKNAIIAWIIGGVVAIASGLTVAEIAAAIPKTGGMFVYLKELYGEKIGFLYGWVQSIIYVPGALAALVIVFSTEITNFINISKKGQIVLSITIIVFLTIMNILSTKLGNKIQGIATIGKLIPLIAIVFLGFTNTNENIKILDPSLNQGIALSGFGAAILGTLWAYDGWVSIGNMAGELKNPKKDLPRSIIIGLALITIIYVSFNIALMKILPADVLAMSPKAASDATVTMLGSNGAKFVSIGILVSIFGAINGYMITGVRIPYAMAKDGLAPFNNFFGKINEKYQTPANALVVQGVIACIYVLSGSFDILTNLVMFTMWIFFVMAIFGIFILRKKFNHIERSYKVPLYPVIPLIGLIGGIYILVSTLINNTLFAVLGVILTLLGWPIYLYIKRQKVAIVE